MKELPLFAKQHLVLETYDECFDTEHCSSSWETQQELEQFAEWMEFVHSAARESGIEEEDYKLLGLNIWKHSHLYKLFKKRQSKALPKFFELLSKYEGKIFYNYRLEGSHVIDIWKTNEELD